MSQILQGFVRALVVSAIASAVPLFAQADNTKANAGAIAPRGRRHGRSAEREPDRSSTHAEDSEGPGACNKTLSTYAHNVKIVSQDGHVTLKGPVRSDEEVKSVEAAATKVAGAGHVSNELTVAPPASGK